MISRKTLLTLLTIASCLLSSTSARQAQAQQPGKSPHIVDEPPLSPAEQQKKFHLPPGFEIQLVAAEPDIRKPINMNFDSAGRLCVTGSIEYPYAAEEGQGRDTVVRFEIGPDGRAVRSETIVAGLNIPIGISPWNKELFVFSIPRLLRCRDVDGDGKFEEKTPLITGFGAKDTHGMVNNITPWIDGWIYTCHGYSNQSEARAADGSTISMQSGNTFRWRPDGTHIEQFTHGQVNPFGMAFDTLGNLFTADCHTLPAYQILRGGWYPSFGKPHDGLGYAPSIMKHQHGSTGISGIVYYAAEQFPEEYRNTIYIGNPITNRVNHDKLTTHGSSYEALEQPDFLACDDRWFRPVDLKLGPDGALYIADFYNRIIGHYEVPLDHPQRDRERGRIWRVVYTGKGAAQPTMPNVAKADGKELLQLLGHENLTVRTFATNRLAAEPELVDPKALEYLLATTASSQSVPGRIHALWILERTGRLSEALLAAAIDDADRTLRVHALKLLAERDAAKVSPPDLARIRAKLGDADPFVRRAAADALGRHRNAENIAPLLACWKATPADDTHLIYTLRMALRDHLLLPGMYAQLPSIVASGDAATTQLCDVSLGVPTAESAAYVLEKLGQNPKVAGAAEWLAHGIRYLPESRLADAYALLAIRTTQPLGQRLEFFRTVQKASAARGAKIPAEILRDEELFIGALMKTDDVNLVRQAIEVARDMKSENLFLNHLEPLTTAQAKFADLRGPALEAAVACNRKAGLALGQGLLASAGEPIALRQKAAQVLGSLGDDAAAQAALASQLATAPERLGVEIAAALANTKGGAALLLESVEKGKATPWVLKEQVVVRNLKRSGIEEANPRYQALTQKLPARNDRLAKLIEERRKSYVGAKPDMELGKALFVKNCRICHRLAGDGNKIGPELDGIGVRGLDRILEDVLDPNRNVDQTFRALQIETKDGRVLTGLRLREEGELIVLADAQGQELRIPRNTIEEQTVLPSSPMPSNVADLLNETDFRHLIAYLLSQLAPAATQPASPAK
ncbi:MAG: HEAT repeat domain-containing protein [Planctomycetia bacterium]|nr:HEAT repeat domain-containing protein [Planctomycetia bacterium]